MSEYHDENTLFKVHAALESAGADATDAISAMQNAGILFRERSEEGDVDPTLLWLLRRAGDEWGQLGVALTAARLTSEKALIQRLQERIEQEGATTLSPPCTVLTVIPTALPRRSLPVRDGRFHRSIGPCSAPTPRS